MPVASTYSQRGRKKTAADPFHCDGIDPQSYGTLFKVVTYDTSNQMLSLELAYFVGSECEEYWTSLFEAYKCLPGFDVTELTSIVDQEKTIDTAYHKVMRNAKLFLDPLHVKKNMGLKLGNDKDVVLSMYDRSVCVPSKREVAKIIS